MNKKVASLIDSLMSASERPVSLKIIEKIFIRGIPFNRPHGLQLKKLTPKVAVVGLPFKRVNKNHIGTMHACAIATLGEFPAGLVLIKNLKSIKYRLVMTELQANYNKHATTNLYATCTLPQKKLNSLQSELEQKGLGTISLITDIFNSKDEKIATLKTTWQIKSWDAISRKN